ncbi:MAG TPA: xanthine dehydrogenase family protein subunit M [Thermomicrobiales bacterium]|nr:xanthine dehydrogenase family protein subunit M [Thermomicrobiales bacterium]
MNPAAFAYHRAASLDEAIALLGEHGDGAKLLAGGHSLLPVMKLRLAEPAHLIDISRIDALRGARDEGGELRIGALTTHHALTREPLVAERAPLLAAAAAVVGDRQVRNRGTLGGALAHADAAADEPAAILALRGRMIARGPKGEREISADDFFVEFLTTALAPDEVLTEIAIPVLPARSGASYQKLANQASGYAIVGVAAVVALDVAGRCADASIAITGASSVVQRASAAEAALRGSDLGADAIAKAAAQATEGLVPLDDIHASGEYRLQVTRGLVRRALQAAADRARRT